MENVTFEKHFNHFRELTIHKDACQNQIDDMKTAFFGGALTLINELLATDDDLSEADMFKKLDAINAELKNHFELLKG